VDVPKDKENKWRRRTRRMSGQKKGEIGGGSEDVRCEMRE
jgi:hypothetical protein